MRPIGIDLFAGAGGLSLGFEQAGFDIAGAVEIDPIHCAVHKFNFPHTPVIARTIEGLSAKEVRKTLRLGNRRVDCVFGGPPCQGFSMIGRRALEDPRNLLVGEFVRLVAELDARTFVFENVKGLTVGAHRAFLSELVEAFDQAGYKIHLPWKVLDVANFGVPQHRERLILFGARKGEKLPDYPIPSTQPADRPMLLDALPVGPNCEDALGDLPNAESFDCLSEFDAVRTHEFGEARGYAHRLRTGDWNFGYKRIWDSSELTSSARTVHTAISRLRFSETAPGTVEPISRFYKLSPKGLANTLRAGTDSARGAFTSPRPIHYALARCVTVREMARLHGFPDWFRFHSTKWHGARQIGNSVPPPLARAIASQVLSSLGVKPTKPENRIRLGDPTLLHLEMSEAAEHFGVRAPIGKRNRKSGAKKRKQHETEAARLRVLKRA